ncbi:hypothetical protein DL96DRAFT_1519399 [Flagelloscypha sp. PMI_526]|nr:hypothetical protein DL96DRAFT_1519399 [Flagelloscypha sp. PMI_526]
MLPATRLAGLFTVEYAKRINAQIVYPAASVLVKPNELESSLARPIQTCLYEPHQSAAYLAATLSYGIIKGHPFMDGNKRTAFFLANEYLRAQGLPGLAGGDMTKEATKEVVDIVERFVGIASGKLSLDELAS